MTNLTVRNIPDEIMEKIRTLSSLERRSVNNEILILLETGILGQVKTVQKKSYSLNKKVQLEIWENLCGQWKDKRSTKIIVKDIISKRSSGRKVEL